MLRLPDFEKISDIGMSLERLTEYLNKSVLKDIDISLTPTMITNYVKAKIVPNSINKKYFKRHIALFIMVAILKSVLTMDQIKIFFDQYDIINEVNILYDNFKSALENKQVNDLVISSLAITILSKFEIDQILKKREAKQC